MNSTQVQAGTFAPLIAFVAGLLAGKGVFGLDAATWATVIGAAVAFGATIWGVVATRKTALAQTLGAGGAIVVTDAATAAATTSSNVVSASDVKVVNK
jgi:hypothetical protein